MYVEAHEDPEEECLDCLVCILETNAFLMREVEDAELGGEG